MLSLDSYFESDDDAAAAAPGNGATVLSDANSAKPAKITKTAPAPPSAKPAKITNTAPAPPRRRQVSTADAKAEYFLTPADLRGLRCESYGGGIGCGAPRKFYFSEDLERCALAKHGAVGFQNKRDAREKRQEKKRQREADADAALQAMRQRPAMAPVFEAAAAGAAPTPTVTPLRKSLLKMAKKALGFTDGGCPKNWRIEAPCIQPASFAALAGRPADVSLRTFVKTGAYYSVIVDACELFGCRESDLLRFFSREGVGIQIHDDIQLKFKPSDGTLAMLGAGEIRC